MDVKNLQADPAAFRAALLIDTDAGPKRFAECMDPWQAEDFAALDDGWKRAVLGTKHEAQYQRGWLERARGHSKTLDLGINAEWALFASNRPLSGIAAAADQDQGRLLRDSIARSVHCNPWLSNVIEVQNYRVVNPHTGSTLDILSSDVASSWGLTPDFVICDEVVHWRRRDLWDSLISSAAKRSTCMVACISNAGISDDWSWQVREAVRQDPKWYFSRLEGCVASWISQDTLDEQQRLLPGVAFERLWLNRWTSGGGDALTEEVLNAAFIPELRPHALARSGLTYVCGVDLGVSRDASALVVLGIDRNYRDHGTVYLANVDVWLPNEGEKVNLQHVEDRIVALHRRFKFKEIRYDPSMAHQMVSRLQAGGTGRITYSSTTDRTRSSRRRPSLPMIEVFPHGNNLQRMASSLLEAFNDFRVRLYPEADLRRDLRRARVEERSYGFRVTFPRDQHGHGDAGTAFMLALLGATEIAARKRVKLEPMWDDNTEDRDPEVRREEYEEEVRSRYDKNESFRAAGGFRQCVTRAAARKQQRPASRHAPAPQGFRGMPAPGPSRSSDPSGGRSPGDVFGGGGSTGRSPRDLFGL